MATKAAAPASEEMRRMTAERAYLIWESQGRPHGYHQQHWAQAESELTAKPKGAKKATATIAKSAKTAEGGKTKTTATMAKGAKRTLTAASASAAMAAGASTPAKGAKKPTSAKKK